MRVHPLVPPFIFLDVAAFLFLGYWFLLQLHMPLTDAKRREVRLTREEVARWQG